MAAALRGALHFRACRCRVAPVSRLSSIALLFLGAASMSAALAADAGLDGPPPVLAALERQLAVARFVVGRENCGKDPAGVLIAATCKRLPDDPRLMPAAAAWDDHKLDSKAIAIAIVDESSPAASRCTCACPATAAPTT